MNQFRDKVAIVTGAGSGIGRELALGLARSGARVVITDLVQERIDQVVREIRNLGVDCRGYLVDHADYAKVGDFTRRFFADMGRTDVLCLNAGVGVGGRIEEYSIADWEWVLGNNLWSTIYMVHGFVPKMIAQGGGSILITASGAGLVGLPGMAPYCTTKFGLVGLGEALRIELAGHNIGVSVLCPGVIKTRIIRDGRIHLADQAGHSRQNLIEDFYSRFGTDPATVAKAGLRALRRNKGVQPTPFHMRFLWRMKWFSSTLYQYCARIFWQRILLK